MLTPEQQARFDEIRRRRDSTMPSKGREISTVLSDRELETVRLVADGLDDDEIGRRLHLTVWTVRSHKQRAKLKLGAATIPQMIANAFRRGYLTVDGQVDRRMIEELELVLVGVLDELDALRPPAQT